MIYISENLENRRRMGGWVVQAERMHDADSNIHRHAGDVSV